VILPSSLLLPAAVTAPTATTPAAEHGDAGPRPAADDPTGPLPRRIPRREAPEQTPLIPAARGGEPPATDSPAAARPLRRRVRGATLRTTTDTAARPVVRQEARPVDAEAVRSALDEFEAAVERAHRDTDSDTASTPYPTPRKLDQNHLPEGAEQ
jgi:hypothetical protein